MTQPTISSEEIRKIAGLAMLELDERDIPALSKDISSILDWAKQLQEVDVTDLPRQEIGIPLYTGQKPVQEDPAREKMLSHTSQTKDGFYVVPKVVE